MQIVHSTQFPAYRIVDGMGPAVCCRLFFEVTIVGRRGRIRRVRPLSFNLAFCPDFPGIARAPLLGGRAGNGPLPLPI